MTRLSGTALAEPGGMISALAPSRATNFLLERHPIQ
jgi:hypothetical protein